MMSADLRCRCGAEKHGETESNSGNRSLNCFDRLRLRVAHSASAVLLSAFPRHKVSRAMRIRFPGKLELHRPG